MLWAAAVCTALLVPASGLAQEQQAPTQDEGPTLLSYGLKGLWTGAVVGLATGYISTGSSYQSHEWRKLVVGAGTGALVGVGAGLALALLDNGKPVPAIGWLTLRDTGYGSMLGVLTGAAVGALYWAGGGRPRDVLMGGSIGTLVGAGVGAAFGVVEGLNAQSRQTEARPAPSTQPGSPKSGGSSADPGAARIQLTVAVVPASTGMAAIGPALLGRF